MQNTIELIRVYLDKNLSVGLEINIIAICIIVFIAIITFLIWHYLFKKHSTLEINEAELGIGSHKIKIKPNYIDMQVAFKLWVEISTRKIALPIDFENDIIADIYKSWYDFFKIAREHIKEIPVKKIKNKSTLDIINVAIRILNDGIRIHLTKWYGKYQRWYSSEAVKDKNKELDPQTLQRLFPKYNELIQELNIINHQLIKYKKILEKIFI